jgi:hypothetical protein
MAGCFEHDHEPSGSTKCGEMSPLVRELGVSEEDRRGDTAL